MKDKKMKMAITGAVVLVVIVIAVCLIPVFGNMAGDSGKNTVEIVQADTTAEPGVGQTIDSQRNDNIPEVQRENAAVIDSGTKTGGVESSSDKTIKVTFIELGSVRCIPCKMMQPVMKSIEEKYKGVVKVVFYDVWTPEGDPYAKEYGIAAIPTQVFKDKNGNEYFRHAGFFPLAEVEKIIKKQL